MRGLDRLQVVLIAHSHGTVIASEVLFRLWEAVDNDILDLVCSS